MDWKAIAVYASSALVTVVSGIAIWLINKVNANDKALHARISALQEKHDARLRELENHHAAMDAKLDNITATTKDTAKDVKKLLIERRDDD